MVQFDIKEFTKNPKKYLDSLTIPEIVAFLEKASYEYYNTQQTLVSDDLFDYIKDYLELKDPNHPFLSKVGAPEDRKTKLPIWMGSQDKIRDDPKTLQRWSEKYKAPYILTDKLDGNSGLFVYDKKGGISLYTRGDGLYGQNISAVLPYITKKQWDFSMLDKKSKYPLMVRGEFIISKKGWDKIKDRGANARNVVAGILHSKTHDLSLTKYLEFVAYELLEPEMDFQEGLESMKSFGFTVVDYEMIDKDSLTMDYLSKYLMDRRMKSPYEIDGIVVRDNNYHTIISGKNPKYSFAFKTLLTHEEAEVMVSHVEWNVSKDGFLKPLVHFNPIHIGGVKIQKATGFNGSYIKQHTIGPGSKIIVIRSGDVIPHIIKILTPAANGKASMPEIPYEWNETGVDIQIKQDVENDQFKLKQLEHFTNTLDIPYIASGILKKLFDAGITTIPQLIALQKNDFLLIEGIKEKGAEKMSQSIRNRMKTVTCEELMVASNLFGRGFGLKKIQSILSENPMILKQELVTQLNPVKGIGAVTIQQFLTQLPKFYEFLKEINISCKPVKKIPIVVSQSNELQGKSIVFTGFRNKEWEKQIEAMGGKVSNTISKNTFLVVATNLQEDSQKVQKGRELGILIEKEAFAKKYHLK